MRIYLKPAALTFSPDCFWDGGILFSDLDASGIEMTSLRAIFLASLLDLKDRTCSIFRLGPGALLSGNKQTKNYYNKARVFIYLFIVYIEFFKIQYMD